MVRARRIALPSMGCGSMPDSRQLFGERGEALAIAELRRRGYRIISRNFRCRLGEIDIIAADGDTLVFVEVKSRKGKQFGSPAAAVTSRKQRQISRVAQYYLLKQASVNRSARFDVVTVLCQAGALPEIELIKNAFDRCEE